MAVTPDIRHVPAPGPGRRWSRMRRAGLWCARSLGLLLAVAVLATTGFGWSRYRALEDAVHRSGALAGLAAPPTTDAGPAPLETQNILVMGLDSRLDENGDPLPPADYAAMNTGGADVGGYNANVLMLLHVPGDGSRATALSIPRDDYVDLAGSPDGEAHGKIKQAYGLAFDQQRRALLAQGISDKTVLEQRSRDAGRNAEIATVSQFLGVPIDHFVEVTLVAFYQIAQVVQPITVCLQEDTRDTYSGANFHAGYQQIDAAQAVAFVRQRRDYDHPELNFTDLDRERRQQAFIASLAYQLKQAGTFADPTTLSRLLDVARQNTAVDPGLDLMSLASRAGSLTSGNITFATLPIVRFGTDPIGEDVNIVDPAAVRAVVQTMLAPPSPSGAPSASAAPTADPSAAPTTAPTTPPAAPTADPSAAPTTAPTTPPAAPTAGAAAGPSASPSADPAAGPLANAISGGGVPCVK